MIIRILTISRAEVLRASCVIEGLFPGVIKINRSEAGLAQEGIPDLQVFQERVDPWRLQVMLGVID